MLVLEWLSRARNISKRKDEWQKGWDMMKRKDIMDAPTPEELFQPDYDESGIYVANTPNPEEYCPSEPQIEAIEVEHVDLVRRRIALKQGRQVFNVTLNEKMLGDARSMTSISRKLAVQNRPEKPLFKKLKPVKSVTIRNRLTKFIGVEAR